MNLILGLVMVLSSGISVNPELRPVHRPYQNLASLASASHENLFILSGERGIMFRSEDSGHTWSVIRIPFEGLITGLYFYTGEVVFAIGHQASVLRSEDAGKTWTIVQQETQSDRPLFQLRGFDDRLIAVGAYGLILESLDSGKTWNSVDHGLEDEPHFYAITEVSGGRLLSGEFGTLVRWIENSFERVAIDYGGSLFGLYRSGNRIAAYGLRGTLFRSVDEGRTWTRLPSPTQLSIYGLLPLSQDRLLVVGAGGLLMVLNEDWSLAADLSLESRMSITGAQATERGEVLLSGSQPTWMLLGVEMLSLGQ